MSQLFECKLDYTPLLASGVMFEPFTPIVGTICTLLRVNKAVDGDTTYQFEEVKVLYPYQSVGFDPEFWREITNIPSIEEITEMVEEVQINYIPFEV